MLIVIIVVFIISLVSLMCSVHHNIYETYRAEICIMDTSLIHDGWMDEYFKVQRFKKGPYMYGDTITMKAYRQYEISYISPHQRIVTLFSKNDSSEIKIFELADYVKKKQMSVVDIWVRTAVEKDIARVIFASTIPDVAINIRYTTNPFSSAGVYCFLLDLRDPILEYARTTPVSLFTYDKMDKSKSSYFLPYHETSMVDVASIFGVNSTDGRRTMCMSFTYCIWSLVSLNYMPPIDQREGTDKIGFFDQYFNVSKYLIAVADQLYSERAREFVPKPKNKWVVLKRENDYMMIEAQEPLPKGYVWVLKGEGVYENAFPADMTNVIESRKLGEDKVIVTMDNVPLSYHLVYFKDLKKMGQITKRDGNNIVHVLIRNNDVDKIMYLSKYKCVTNDQYEFDFQCKEENGDVWDRPCMNDFECPFYNMERGGCKTDGFCELPVGVKPIGFRKYEKDSKPFCKDCPDRINDPYCCNNNGNYYFD